MSRRDQARLMSMVKELDQMIEDYLQGPSSVVWPQPLYHTLSAALGALKAACYINGRTV